MMKVRVLLAATMLISAPALAQQESGTLASGARWVAQVPAKWNGTLLLYSRGYSAKLGAPDIAPRNLAAPLLEAGYALAASDYGASGWSLEQAVPAQLDTLAAFRARHGQPRRVIAWGNSMGGLVTAALAEQRPAKIHGAAAFCSSIGGAVGMMNMALDGAFAFKTLLAPESDIRVVGIDDDQVNGKRVGEAIAAARQTPEGRARLVLAGVLAGIPGWTKPGSPRPAPADLEAQADQIADSFVMGVYLPRTDQERRAGGVFSWNRGIDYRQQLALSGRRELVEGLYRKAGLDLDGDLRRLNSAPRITASPRATAYMMRHYTPNARPSVPLLAVQAIGDGLTPPSLQQGYADAARAADVQSLWVDQAGHCNFAPETVMAAIRHIDRRLASGKWPARPIQFVAYRAPPMLRPCVRGGRCR